MHFRHHNDHYVNCAVTERLWPLPRRQPRGAVTGKCNVNDVSNGIFRAKKFSLTRTPSVRERLKK